MADDRKVLALPAHKAEPSGAILETDGPDPQFLHSVLCQVSLPRNPTRETIFTKSCGRVSITLQAGLLFDGVKMVPQPLPSGTRPRLVLLHVCTEAVKTRSPDVAIGQSVRGFLRELHIDAGGENMRQFRAQMRALAACHMILGAPSPEGPVTLAAKTPCPRSHVLRTAAHARGAARSSLARPSSCRCRRPLKQQRRNCRAPCLISRCATASVTMASTGCATPAPDGIGSGCCCAISSSWRARSTAPLFVRITVPA